MDEMNKPKKRQAHPDRITLKPEALQRLETWNSQLADHLKGQRLKRGELLHWLILSHSDKLSEAEVGQIEQEFFDEIKFAQWAVKKLKEARAKGQNLELTELIAQSRNSSRLVTQ